MQVTVRYFAGARAAAGMEGESVSLNGTAPTVADLVSDLVRRHGEPLASVLTACSYLVDEVGGDHERPLREHSQVDVLPPFAGG